MRRSSVPFVRATFALAVMLALTACSSAASSEDKLSSPSDTLSNAHLVTSSAVAAQSDSSEDHIDSSDDMDTASSAFDPDQPSLGGIALGMSKQDIKRLLGQPAERYNLADGSAAVSMNEYDRLTVGFNSHGMVVYIEISAPGAETGIAGVEIGAGGPEAAAALGLPFYPDSQVLSCQVTGGLLKVDLTPDTHRVLSIKLVGQP